MLDADCDYMRVWFLFLIYLNKKICIFSSVWELRKNIKSNCSASVYLNTAVKYIFTLLFFLFTHFIFLNMYIVHCT